MTENNTAELIARQKKLIRQAQTLTARVLGLTMRDAVKVKKIIPADNPNYPTVFKAESIADILKLQSSLNDAAQALQEQEQILNVAPVIEHANTVSSADLEFEAEFALLRSQAETIAGISAKDNAEATEARIQAPQSTKLGMEDIDRKEPPIKQPLIPPPPPENSLGLLESLESPLVEIFAPGPWFPDGKGRVTVGSNGFKWYKDTDPFDRSEAVRATLPTGFYSGDNRPTKVVLRLETCILAWDFDLNVEKMLVYVAGVSDTNAESPRWLRASELTASLSGRLLRELRAKKKEIAE